MLGRLCGTASSPSPLTIWMRAPEMHERAPACEVLCSVAGLPLFCIRFRRNALLGPVQAVPDIRRDERPYSIYSSHAALSFCAGVGSRSEWTRSYRSVAPFDDTLRILDNIDSTLISF